MNFPQASGPVFSEDERINLYYLNELYGNIADHVSRKMREVYQMDVPITSGIWGGTYLIAEPNGKSKRRIWRLYCIINLPQKGPLERHENLEKLVAVYSDTFAQAFKPYNLALDLKMWGGRLPYSNKAKPNITLHMADACHRVHWLRAIYVWNLASWEESIIYETVRLIKEMKDSLNLEREPVLMPPQELKFLMQDIIITYRTIRNACSPEFIEHAEPIIEEMTQHFLVGLHDPHQIQDLFLKVYESALIYGFEEGLEGPYARAGLDIRQVENWPKEKINWVPEELREKLVPPIKELFSLFKTNLGKNTSLPA